jgi:membrane associated rhomboid family serine protease
VATGTNGRRGTPIGRVPKLGVGARSEAVIPLSDNLPTLRPPLVTYLLLGTTVGAWVLVQGAGFDEMRLAASVCDYGMVPGELTGRAPLGMGVPIARGMACVVDAEPINRITPVTSMFLHGGWGHLLGNAMFFWVFGNNVEDSMGRLRFLVFYLLCGLAAAAAHVLLSPASPVPTVGASGAISGVLGAYLLLYPRARVNMLFIIIFFIRVIPIQAWMVLLWWFAWQVIAGLPELMTVDSEVSGGVAVWAHVGGFVAGVLLVKPFANPRLVAAHHAEHGEMHGYRWR